LTGLWLVSYAAILLGLPDPDPFVLTYSLLYLLYYFGLSLYLSGKILEERRAQESEA
jgi:phosphatidylcholine synthase